MQGCSNDSVEVENLRHWPSVGATTFHLEEEDPEETKKIEELKRQQRERQKARDRQREKQAPPVPPDSVRDPRATGIHA